MLYQIKYSYKTSETVYMGPFVGDVYKEHTKVAYVEAPNVARAMDAIANFVKPSQLLGIVVLSDKVYHA